MGDFFLLREFILCLEAWLGFRFVRACALMWRWERQAAADRERERVSITVGVLSAQIV